MQSVSLKQKEQNNQVLDVKYNEKVKKREVIVEGILCMHACNNRVKHLPSLKQKIREQNDQVS